MNLKASRSIISIHAKHRITILNKWLNFIWVFLPETLKSRFLNNTMWRSSSWCNSRGSIDRYVTWIGHCCREFLKYQSWQNYFEVHKSPGRVSVVAAVNSESEMDGWYACDFLSHRFIGVERGPLRYTPAGILVVHLINLWFKLKKKRS